MALERRPHIGDRLRFPDGTSGVVTKLDDDICWFASDDRIEARYWNCFIWRFNDGLNREAEILEAQR